MFILFYINLSNLLPYFLYLGVSELGEVIVRRSTRFPASVLERSPLLTIFLFFGLVSISSRYF
jgi:hypothetical protein